MKLSSFHSNPIKPYEITPESIYLNRRAFMKTAGSLSAAAILASCVPVPETDTPQPASSMAIPPQMDEPGGGLTPYEVIVHFNNFYEFSINKKSVASLAQNFTVSPWEIEIGGLVQKPQMIALEDLLKKFAQEERIYRFRCVEGWSMVIPWLGFSLASLINEVQPMSAAKYIRFETLHDINQMPGVRDTSYPWPYSEGLRLDEALHPLTILASGLYGKALPPQDGAPIRLVVPWKYGFKSIKSIVKIEFVEKQPKTFWNTVAPDEYGFYANVNPDVDHPRWSQALERRIGESDQRKTLMFNGYAQDVSILYSGMDLKKNY